MKRHTSIEQFAGTGVSLSCLRSAGEHLGVPAFTCSSLISVGPMAITSNNPSEPAAFVQT